MTVLPFDLIYIQVVMILLIFSIIVVYPVQLNPAFKIFDQNFVKCKNSKKIYENALRSFVVLITVIIGLTSIDKFANYMAIAGSIVCTPIALIFPSIFHFKLFSQKQSFCRSFIDIFITCFGIIISISILIFTLM